jgi:phage gp36-like protein
MYLSIADITKGMRAEILAVVTRNDNEVVFRAILEAQAEVAGYLSARYDIAAELALTPDDGNNRNTMVVKLVRDIAIYNCHNFSAPVNMPENKIRSYENAVKYLRECQGERADVPGLQRLNATAGGGVSSNYLYYGGNDKREHHI